MPFCFFGFLMILKISPFRALTERWDHNSSRQASWDVFLRTSLVGGFPASPPVRLSDLQRCASPEYLVCVEYFSVFHPTLLEGVRTCEGRSVKKKRRRKEEEGKRTSRGPESRVRYWRPENVIKLGHMSPHIYSFNIMLCDYNQIPRVANHWRWQ